MNTSAMAQVPLHTLLRLTQDAMLEHSRYKVHLNKDDYVYDPFCEDTNAQKLHT